MVTEMPPKCKQGEQISIRISVFNYLDRELEAMITLTQAHTHKYINVQAEGPVGKGIHLRS